MQIGHSEASKRHQLRSFKCLNNNSTLKQRNQRSQQHNGLTSTEQKIEEVYTNILTQSMQNIITILIFLSSRRMIPRTTIIHGHNTRELCTNDLHRPCSSSLLFLSSIIYTSSLIFALVFGPAIPSAVSPYFF